jgi:hypothetical protein
VGEGLSFTLEPPSRIEVVPATEDRLYRDLPLEYVLVGQGDPSIATRSENSNEFIPWWQSGKFLD